jgi:hypothetical protein
MFSLDFFSLTAFSPDIVLAVLSAILCLSFTAGGSAGGIPLPADASQ